MSRCSILISRQQQYFCAHDTRRQDFECDFSKNFIDSLCERGYPILHPLPRSTAFARSLDASTPLLGPEHRAHQKLWCPTCAPAQTNSWRRHWFRDWLLPSFVVHCGQFHWSSLSSYQSSGRYNKRNTHHAFTWSKVNDTTTFERYYTLLLTTKTG